jgi:hypothetical protein
MAEEIFDGTDMVRQLFSPDYSPTRKIDQSEHV